jgi:NADH dehydrogenase
MGVEIRTGNHVSAIDEEGVVVAGEHIPARTVIWTAGVKASLAGAWLGAEIDRRGHVKVASDLTVPDHPSIFVLGDTATLNQNGKALPGVAQVAIQQGEYAAAVIAARVAGKEHKQPFHYRNKGTLATIGRSYAIADLGLIRLAGFPAWLIWAFVHLLFLIGFRNRYVTLFQWAWSYLTFERGLASCPLRTKRRCDLGQVMRARDPECVNGVKELRSLTEKRGSALDPPFTAPSSLSQSYRFLNNHSMLHTAAVCECQ